jgi:nickel transport protein
MQKSTQNLLSLAATIGITLLFGAMPSLPPAQALPPDQVVAKLQEVPVFAITNNSGGILRERTANAGKTNYFTRVFISFKDAQKFVDRLKNTAPTQAKNARITAVPLSQIYQMQVDAKKKAENINFVFVPNEQQVKTALGIMKKPFQPNNATGYRVPLFFVAIKEKDKYLTPQLNNLTPFFFEQEQAQQWLERVKKKDPKLVAKAEIKVNDLQGFIEDLHSRNYPEQKQVVLVRSRESEEIVRKIQSAQPKPGVSPSPKK